MLDDFTRECLTLVADTSLPGLRVVRELDVIIARRGRPAMCLSDSGTELTGMAATHNPECYFNPHGSASRQYRLGGVREQLKANDCAACLLIDTINIRYATGRRRC
ncbi:hypothetical protein IVB16_32010 [Bradyrhizobium sp. 183]|nr:hypothetical protein IVB17_32010 [Bradyrhizobium sp. 184]UPJ87122.1 hypothetical protein IVB16_32010 [Bradyrhizobium sp. 183]